MAGERISKKVRKDKKGRALLKGEYQYPNGRYEFTFTNADGEKDKIYSWCLTQTDKPPRGKTSDECLRMAEQRVLKEVAERIDSKKARKLTLDALFEEYMAMKNLKDSTRANYIYTYNKFISPVFGKKKVTTIRNSDIKLYYQSLINDLGFKVNSLDSVHTILHPVFNQAVNDEIIRKNPTDGVMAEIKRSHDRGESKRHALTEEEQEAFMEFMANSEKYAHWSPLFTVILGTGMRVGEITGLRWDDVDFEDNVISVNHNLVYHPDSVTGKCSYRISTPKTKNSIRTIPMLSEVKEVLLEERKRQNSEGPNNTKILGENGMMYENFIFCNRFNEVYHPGSINTAINRIVRDYNAQEVAKAENEHREPMLIRHFSVHNLRHTFCTRFCENETNLKIIQEIMGHSDITTTMDIYNEATKKKKKESFAALEGKVKIS